jgi:DNA-binding MarR family transcriptional regulator
MHKLSDSQLVILSTASQRPDGCVFPITLKLKGNAIGNVLKSLLAKGLLEEVPGRADDTLWRYDDGAPLTLMASPAAYRHLGIDTETTPAADDVPARDRPSDKRKPAKAAQAAAIVETKPRKEPTVRKDSKQAQLIAMLRRAKGATIAEIAEALEWQPHTVRGAIAGALKKKLGLEVVSEKTERRGRVYRIDTAG